MQSLGFEAKNATVYSMIRDISGDDQIDFDTFLDMLTAKVGDTDSREDINKVFALFDVDGKGRINLGDLKRVAKELGETMSDAELLEMVERADRDGDSQITQDDFFLIMTRKVRPHGGLPLPLPRARAGLSSLPPSHSPLFTAP
jgi:Ca2+-binding EF-hand superfamily protein